MTRARRNRQRHRPARDRAKLGNDPELAQKTKAVPGSALIEFPDGERAPKSRNRSGSTRRCQGVFRGYESSPEVGPTLGGPGPELAAPNKLFPKSEMSVRIPTSEAPIFSISESVSIDHSKKELDRDPHRLGAVSIALGATGRIALRGHAYPATRPCRKEKSAQMLQNYRFAEGIGALISGFSVAEAWPKRVRPLPNSAFCVARVAFPAAIFAACSFRAHSGCNRLASTFDGQSLKHGSRPP